MRGPLHLFIVGTHQGERLTLSLSYQSAKSMEEPVASSQVEVQLSPRQHGPQKHTEVDREDWRQLAERFTEATTKELFIKFNENWMGQSA